MPDEAQLESLSAEEIGLPASARIPLRFTPGHTWTPLLVSFPHVGLGWPHDLRPKPQVDFARNADYEVQALYRRLGLAELGVATVEAIYSRLVVDLNRAADDVSARLVPEHPAPRPRRRPGVPADDGDSLDFGAWDRPGRGVVWASAVSAGAGASVRILEPPLPYPAFARRIELYHAPYYRALSILLERRRRRFGFAVLLDAHSMPSSVGLDIVLGTLDGESASEPLVTAAVEALRGSSALLSVKRDHPYRGGELVRRFGRPTQGLHAFQLEVSRRLYMDEQTYSLHERPTRSGALSDSVGKNAPARRRARELAELEARVRSLVRRLAEVGDVRHENAVAHSRVATASAEPASR